MPSYSWCRLSAAWFTTSARHVALRAPPIGVAPPADERRGTGSQRRLLNVYR